MKPFPWAEAMAFGLGVLRLAPEQFWAMTPRELQAAFSAINEGAERLQPPAREDLNRLMQEFPDEDKIK
ncbi:MAG TPA: phage tail assembly chaperone [Devosia sp.]|nr:phage tail assembly chaperone [Devosia sp.]